MANLAEIEQYDNGIYQIEVTDFVAGGADGVTNKPIKQLANRTKWLKSRIDAFLAGTIKVKNAILADTATKLATPRMINGVNFDGSADITVTDNTKAPLASPTFTGTPTAPTAPIGTNNTQIATTEFVRNELNFFTLVDVSSNRANNTFYLNNTGYPIFIWVAGYRADSNVLTIRQNGTDFNITATYQGNNNHDNTPIFGVVPSGASYKVKFNGYSTSKSWFEWRKQ